MSVVSMAGFYNKDELTVRLTIVSYLRVPDCNFRESLAKLEKSKLLIICLKFTFGELSSKILFECSGNF